MITKRMSADAKMLLLIASSEAAALRAEQVGGEHILLACSTLNGSPAKGYLDQRGADRAKIATLLTPTGGQSPVSFDDDDAEALLTLGIDLPQLLERLEGNLGSTAQQEARPQRRPGPARRSRYFADCARSTSQRATAEAATLRSKAVEPGHLLLSVLREPATCCRDLVSALAVDYDTALHYMFPDVR